MTQHFDDMWLALDQELSTFDNYLSDKDWMSTTTTSNPTDSALNLSQDINTPNLSSQSYETLIETLSAPDPSYNELRSKSRPERIEAVKQFYNKIPTIINASSTARLHCVTSKLYRLGHVKTANRLAACEHEYLGETTYIEETPDFIQSMEIDTQNGKKRIVVSIEDKHTGQVYEKTFDNLLDVLKFFRK